MVTSKAFRKSLGKVGAELSESEVTGLLQLQYRLANVLFDVWKNRSSAIVAGKIEIHQKNGDYASVEVFAFVSMYV